MRFILSDHGSQHKIRGDGVAARIATAAVERAIGDLRRGGVVLLLAADAGDGLLVQAAEMASAGSLLAMPDDIVMTCVVPAGRGAALGLPAAGARNIAVHGAGMDSALVRALAGAEDEEVLPELATVPADELQDVAVGLVKLARLLPAALVSSVVDSPRAIARERNLLTVDVADVARYRALVTGGGVTQVTRAQVPLDGAEDTEIVAFRPADGGREHLAIIVGRPDPSKVVLARIHSECLTGDLLGSLRCDCGEQLRGSIQAIAKNGGGVLLYLAQEGRGIGLVNKLRAYRLQDEGFDTIEANERLGFYADERVYRPAAAILRQLGFESVRLLTNNPAKVAGLAACGITVVERVPHAFPANGHNDHYLKTKALRAGHLL